MRISVVCITLVLALFSTPAFAENLRLQDFLKNVQSENLDLKMEQAKLETANAQSSSISLPPPMVSFSKLTEKEGSSAQGFEVSQTVPFPGKISKNKSSRNLEAQAQKLNLAAKQNAVLTEAKQSFFEYWGAYKKIHFLRQKKDILSKHLRLARSGVRSDSSMKLHFVKTDLGPFFGAFETSRLRSLS